MYGRGSAGRMPVPGPTEGDSMVNWPQTARQRKLAGTDDPSGRNARTWTRQKYARPSALPRSEAVNVREREEDQAIGSGHAPPTQFSLFCHPYSYRTDVAGTPLLQVALNWASDAIDPGSGGTPGSMTGRDVSKVYVSESQSVARPTVTRPGDEPGNARPAATVTASIPSDTIWRRLI